VSEHPQRSSIFRPTVDEEVDSEFAFHLEMRTREYIARGWAPEAARLEALRRFGDIRRANRACRRISAERNQRMRRREYLEELVRDIRSGVRQLGRAPGFATVAIVTLALGIGGTSAIFSVVNAVFLKPLPVAAPERVMAVSELWRDRRSNVSVGNLLAWRERTGAFEALAGIQFSSFNLADDQMPARVLGARVTGDFFRVFGVPSAHGRVLGPDDDRPGHEQVVVLSHRLWTRRFAADPAIVGRDVRMNSQPYRIVGVMPASFDWTGDSEELWVPAAFTADDRANFDRHYLFVVGRLATGVTRDQAQARLSTVAAQLQKEHPRENGERSATMGPLLEIFVENWRPRFRLLLAAVTLVLLIACGNVANLLLARGANRSEELAVRTALGAGRARLVRQLLTENIVLAAAGGLCGLIFAYTAVQAFVQFSPPGVPRLEQARLDGLTIAVTSGIALASSLLFGLVPAFRTARPDAHAILKGGRSGGMGIARDRVRQALVVSEVALAMLLLVGSGLLIRTAIALQHVDTGFDPGGVLSARVSLPSDTYTDRAAVVQSFERLADTVRRLPGVSAAAVVSQAPLAGGGNSNGLIPEGRPIEPASAIDARFRLVTPDYFRTMRIPIRQGRAFTTADRGGTPKVMIVSQTLASQAWPKQDPIGKRIACCEAGPDGKSPDWKIVVGVAGDVRWRGPAIDPSPEFYLPIDQAPAVAWDWIQRTMFIVVRTQGDPATFVQPVRTALSGIDASVPLFDVETMEARLRSSMAAARFNTALLTVLGLVGLTLAAIGIYGVIAYSISQRTPEIGVRLALGAAPLDVIRMVIRQALKPVLIGLALGVGGALAASNLLAAQLYGVTPRDPLTIACVSLVFLLVAVLASWAPARRAARVDPRRALNTA
jgi:putative ABC transport system permease protein